MVATIYAQGESSLVQLSGKVSTISGPAARYKQQTCIVVTPGSKHLLQFHVVSVLAMHAFTLSVLSPSGGSGYYELSCHIHFTLYSFSFFYTTV